MRRVFILVMIVFFIASCEDIIGVEDISGNTVEILAPKNDAVLNQKEVTLSWEVLEDADSYALQIANPTFAEAKQIVVDTILSTTQYSVTLDTLNYQWRIKGVNSAYESEYVTNSFRIED